MSTLPSRPANVARRRLADLLQLLPGAEVAGSRPAADAAPITGITHDSRAVRPGDLYLARPGATAHGAAFAAAATRDGAVAIVTDRSGAELATGSGVPVVVVPDPRAVAGPLAADVYGRPADHLLLIGVTGTNGKTTVAYLVEAGLRAAGHVTGLIGTVETRVGELTSPSVRTTPESTDLQALLAVMRERGVTAAAMEVSSHALALGRVDGARFAVAVFTNLSQDHLDFHRDLDDYFAAKARLFTPELALAGVVNVSDRYGARLAASTGIPTTRLATTPADESTDAEWRVVDADLGPRGSTFRLRGPGAEIDGSVALPGAFNVANAAAAVVALVTAGVPIDAAVAGVASVTGVPGRMERVERGQPYAAVVDYAHTPDAVATLLATLREVTAGRLIVVVGCGGDRDRAKRPLMGRAAVAGADVAVLTNDNPRSEDPLAILDATLAGARDVPAERRADVVVEPDRRRAIETAVAMAAAGDTVVVAGKGHETGQDVGGVVSPFDDRVVLGEAIAATASTG